jgi:hypothetical protein
MARKSTVPPARGGRPVAPDYQVDTGQPSVAGGLYEVLVEASNGSRTVFRVNANSHEAAVESLDLDESAKVLKSTLAGAGLGSGDPGNGNRA